MRWFLMMVCFLGGILYLVQSDKAQEKKLNAECEKEVQQIENSAIEMPEAPQGAADLVFLGETVSTLNSFMKDPTSQVYLAVVDILWNLQSPEAVPAIKKILLKKYSYYMPETLAERKRKVVEILDRQQTRLNLELLKIALADQSKNVRLDAIKAIGKYNSSEAIDVLNEYVQDRDNAIRTEAVNSVNSINESIARYKEDKINEVRAQYKKKKPFFKRLAPDDLLNVKY